MSKGITEKVAEVFKPQLPLWACELTEKHVIVAGLSKRRNKIAGKLISELPNGAIAANYGDTNIRDVQTIRSAARDLLTNAGFRGSEIAVVVPDDTARIAFLTADHPSKNAEEQQTFIRWKLKKSVPFDVDSAQVAYRILGPHRSGTGVDILVALSPRSIVQEYEALFDSMAIHAGMVVPSTLASLNLLTIPAGDALFLKIAPDCVTTTVFQNRRIQFYRRVTDLGLYDAVYPTVMYYQDKLEGAALKQLYVCGYDSDLRSGLDEIQEKLRLPPQRVEPKSVEDIFKPALGAIHLKPEGVL